MIKKSSLLDIDIQPAWKEEQKARDRMMNAHNERDDDDEEFNPGRIVYYGRAELKTSDHRFVPYY